MDWVTVGYLLFILINGIDALLTHRILQFGGKEFNVIMRFIYSRWGVRGMLGLKGIVLVLLGYACFTNRLDLYTIWYLNFMFTVILTLMYLDMRSVGCPLFSTPIPKKQISKPSA